MLNIFLNVSRQLISAIFFIFLLVGCGGSDRSEPTEDSITDDGIEQPLTNNDDGNISNSGDATQSTGTQNNTNSSQADLYRSANNTAVLSGPVFGANTRQNSTLRRTLSLYRTVYQNFTVENAFAINYNEARSFVIITLLNTAPSTRCFVELENPVIFDAEDSYALGGLTYNLPPPLIGFTGVANNLYTDTCLAPAEKGYVIITGTFDFNQAAKLAIGNIISEEGTIASPQLSVIPIGYTVSDDQLNIQVQNTGTETVLLSYSHQVIALDESDLPIWSSSNLLNDQKILDPGVITNVYHSFSGSFSGTASKLRSVVLFEEPVRFTYSVIASLFGKVSFSYLPPGSTQVTTYTVAFSPEDITVSTSGDIGLTQVTNEASFFCSVGQHQIESWECSIQKEFNSEVTTIAFRFSLNGNDNLTGRGALKYCDSDVASLGFSVLQDCLANPASSPDDTVSVQVTI